jgi:hypothetical protein
MKAAVWDSYLKKANGNVLHFDVVVPDSSSEHGNNLQIRI